LVEDRDFDGMRLMSDNLYEMGENRRRPENSSELSENLVFKDSFNSHGSELSMQETYIEGEEKEKGDEEEELQNK